MRDRTIPAKVVTEQYGLRCDLCESTYTEGPDDAYIDDDTEIRVSIRRTKGKILPGDAEETWEIDLCPICWARRLVPWLESQGCKVDRKGWDW
jgi:hypothetical protein